MTGDLVLTTDSIYSVEYCSEITDGICTQKYFVSAIGKAEIVEIGTEIFLYSGIMLSFIFVFWYLMRGVFYLFFRPKKKND